MALDVDVFLFPPVTNLRSEDDGSIMRRFAVVAPFGFGTPDFGFVVLVAFDRSKVVVATVCRSITELRDAALGEVGGIPNLSHQAQNHIHVTANSIEWLLDKPPKDGLSWHHLVMEDACNAAAVLHACGATPQLL